MIGGAVVIGMGPDDVRLAGDPPPRSGNGDELVEPDTQAGPGPGRDRDRSERTRDRQQRPGRALPGRGTVGRRTRRGGGDRRPGRVRRASRSPGVDLPDDDDTTPPDGGEEPEPEPAQDVRLVVDTQPREGSSTPITVTVVGLTGEHVGDLIGHVGRPRDRHQPARQLRGAARRRAGPAPRAPPRRSSGSAPRATSAGTVTFTITVPDGTDTDPSNNSVTIPVAGNA